MNARRLSVVMISSTSASTMGRKTRAGRLDDGTEDGFLRRARARPHTIGSSLFGVGRALPPLWNTTKSRSSCSILSHDGRVPNQVKCSLPICVQ